MTDLLIELFKGIVSIVLYGWWAIALLLAFFAWQNRRKTSYVSSRQHVVLQIKIPKTNDKNPTAAEMMFATLHGIRKPETETVFEGSLQDHISFEIVADQNTISFYVWTPKHLRDFVEGQVYAQYPSADIVEIPDYARRVDGKGKHIAGAEIYLERPDYLPIKTFNNFQVDPLAAITGVLAKLDSTEEQIWIQILARPVSDKWKRRGLNWIANKKGGAVDITAGNWKKTVLLAPLKLAAALVQGVLTAPPESSGQKTLSVEDESRVSAIEEKSEKLGYEVIIRTLYVSPEPKKAHERIQAVLGAFKQFNTTNLNGFKGRRIFNDRLFLSDYQNRLFIGKKFHLNIEELASIYHLPHTSVETPNINWTTSKTGEPPTVLPTAKNTDPEDLTEFAETNFRSHRQIFGIKRDDRRRHMYIIGKSGMGKTKLLENLINDDIKKSEGVAIIDPHGDFTTDTLNKIPSERINDVILFDPADTEFPISYNPMEVIDESLKIQIAAGIVGTFKKIFGDSWGPRLEYILNYTVLALLDTEGSTLLGIVRMLTDKNFRKKIVANIQDPVVKKFWTTEFASYNERFATEAIAPILNKVGQFVANSLIRNVIGQPKSSFNIRKAMDEKKILLINLSMGRVGETNASLLGSLMITSLQLAAMSRADMAESKRGDFYLYVDEFQNFATESFKNILSEARKYRLNLIIANQYIGQIEDSGVKDAVFGNAGTIMTFRVGAEDANELAQEFNPPFEAQDLINLPKQHIYVRMTIDGQSEPAFSAKTLTVTDETTGNLEAIVKQSREKYTRPKAEVEKDVAGWSGIEITEPTSLEAPLSTVTDIATSEAGEKSFATPIVKQTENNKSKSGKEVSPGERKDFTESIMKRAERKKRKEKGLGHGVEVDKLKEAIKESTAHVTGKKKEEKPEPSAVKQEHTPTETPVKIKDKIDKDTLSAILGSIVTPKENPEVKKETRSRIEHMEKEVDDKDKSNKHKGLEQAQQKIREKIGERHLEPTQKEEQKTKLNKKESGPAFPSTKKEKIITPENFKKVKAIHPHEVVKVHSNDSPKKIEEGQTIKFE